MVELGHAEPPAPDEPGPFAFAQPGLIQALLEEAGFDDIVVRTLEFGFHFASTDEHFEHQRALSTRLDEELGRLSPAEHTRVRDAIDVKLAPFTAPDGAVDVPARTWVAAATA
jgi:hypothetical protein